MKSNGLDDVERVSALTDGALSSEQFTVAMESLLSDLAHLPFGGGCIA